MAKNSKNNKPLAIRIVILCLAGLMIIGAVAGAFIGLL